MADGSTVRRPRRRFLKTAAAAGVSTGLAGCTLSLGGPRAANVVQLAASSAERDVQADINDALQEAGLPSNVHLEILASSGDIAQQQFSQWLSAGLERPSLFRMDSGWTIPFVERNQVVNLTEAAPDVARTVEERYFESTVSTVQGSGGNVYGVPLFSDFGLMLYRKDLVREAGFDPGDWATNPIPWRRFAEIAKTATAESDVDYGFTFQGMLYEGLSCCTFNEFMTTRGGSYFGARENLFGPVGERPVTVNSRPVKDALGMLRAFLYGEGPPQGLDVPGDFVPRAVLQWDEDPSLDPFLEGNAVMHRNWPYAVLETGSGEVFGEDLGVMPIPTAVPPGEAAFGGMGGSKSALGGWNVCLNPNAAEREAALQVLEAMTADSFSLTLLETLGYLPPKPAVLDTDEARDVEVMGRYLDTIKFAGEHAVPRPVTVVWPQESTRIAQQVSAAMSRDQTPEEAMRVLEQLLTRIENSAREGDS